MVEEQAVLEFMREKAYRPLTFAELAEAFGVRGAPDNAWLKELFARMEEEGVIVRTRTDRYGVAERMDLVVGRLEVKARGFGFVVPVDRSLPDLYVAAADLADAMDGDRVLVRPQKGAGGARQEGEIIRVLKRAHHTIVGVLATHVGYGFVKPDDKHLTQDVFVAGEDLEGAADGQKVVVEITEYPTMERQSASGKVIEVLGFPNDPGVDILSIVRKYGLPLTFPDDVLQEAERIPDTLFGTDLEGRRDLRGEMVVTIDGPDAKDLDDAVQLKKLPNGNHLLGVHIADVSYYVRAGSALDREAQNRGTSVYLIDRVIPMLPPRLSNGICSLNPNVDRLTMTCDMEWSPSLELVRHEIYPSVIRSAERMTYGAVRDILAGTDAELAERYQNVAPMFHEMETFAQRLRARRMARGAIDFDFAETKIRVDEWGKPLDIVQRERGVAEMVIEEFMLAANETVAEHFFWMEVPFLYRVHEPPALEKMTALNEFVHNFGYHLKAAGNIHPRVLQDLLLRVRGRAEEVVVSHVMLRSLKQARYAAESLGHFGLAAEYYSHFTSPIRRYPDLMIHRVIREVIAQGALSEERHAYLRAIMPEVAMQSSERERTAVDAERETDLVKKIEFMLDKVGDEFDGMISGVTGFGLFVQLDNSVEGLIHVSYLEDDYYHYHEKLHALIGERMKRVYRIGDRLRVKILSASKENLSIDFALVAKIEGDELAWIGDESRGTEFAGDGGRRSGAGKGGRHEGVAGAGGGGRKAELTGGRARSGAAGGHAGGGSGGGSGPRAAGDRNGGRAAGGGRSGPRASGRNGDRAAGGNAGGGRKAGLSGGRRGGRSGAGMGGHEGGGRAAGGDEREHGATSARGAKPSDISAAGGGSRSGIAAAARTSARVGSHASGSSGHSGSMPPVAGGHSRDIEARRIAAQRKKHEREALQDIAVTYGAPVKDKVRRRRRRRP
ncbi:MAG: ribonuclease R [Bacilli bacterium]